MTLYTFFLGSPVMLRAHDAKDLPWSSMRFPLSWMNLGVDEPPGPRNVWYKCHFGRFFNHADGVSDDCMQWSSTVSALLNLLWPSDAIWPQKSGTTVAKLMVCCLTAPSHYLNQCWTFKREVPLPESDFTVTAQAPFTIVTLKIILWDNSHISRGLVS